MSADHLEDGEELYAATVLRRRAGSLLQELAALRQSPADDSIHDTRVQSRRMRAALDAFRDLYDAGQWQRCYEASRQVTRTLGRVRESEVVLALVPEITAGADEAENICREYLEERFRRRLAKLKTRLKKDLADLDVPDLKVQFESLIGEIGPLAVRTEGGDAAADTSGMPLPSPATERPPARSGGPLARARQELTELSRPLLGFRAQRGFSRIADERLHRLRIDVKRLRYAMEVFSDAWPAGLEKEIGLARALQDAAGTHQDWAVFRERLRREIRRLTRNETTHLAFQMGRLLARLEDRKTELRRDILPALTVLQSALAGLLPREAAESPSVAVEQTVRPRARSARRVGAGRISRRNAPADSRSPCAMGQERTRIRRRRQ